MAEKKTSEPKRLYRSKKDKVIAGVCGGIAEYFNIDPVWARLVAVLLIFADGIGIILYIVAWILMPANPVQKDTKQTSAERAADKLAKKVDRRNHVGILIGGVLVLIGLFTLARYIFPWFSFHYLWPVLLIAIGGYLLLWRHKDEQ